MKKTSFANQALSNLFQSKEDSDLLKILKCSLNLINKHTTYKTKIEFQKYKNNNKKLNYALSLIEMLISREINVKK